MHFYCKIMGHLSLHSHTFMAHALFFRMQFYFTTWKLSYKKIQLTNRTQRRVNGAVVKNVHKGSKSTANAKIIII